MKKAKRAPLVLVAAVKPCRVCRNEPARRVGCPACLGRGVYQVARYARVVQAGLFGVQS